MAKIKTQGRDRPWLPDDRPVDVRHKEFLSDDPPTVGWLLMEAWDKAGCEFWSDMDDIADACERDAGATRDARMSAVMKDIAKRISAMPQSPMPDTGASTREELLNAAYERVAATGGDADAINTERDALRREYLRRATESPRRMVDALNRDIATLEATDVPCAAYLRNRVAELQKVIGPDDANSLVNHEGITRDRSAGVSRKDSTGKARRDDLSPIIDRARGVARNRDDPSEVWNVLTEMASEKKPPMPLLAFKDGEIEHGDPASKSYLSRDAFGSRFRRLTRREQRGP